MTTQVTTTSGEGSIYIPQTIGGASGAVSVALTSNVLDSRTLEAAEINLASQQQNLNLKQAKQSADVEVGASALNAGAQAVSAGADFAEAINHGTANYDRQALDKEFIGEYDPKTGKAGKITHADLELRMDNGDTATLGDKYKNFQSRGMDTEAIKNERNRDQHEYKSRKSQIKSSENGGSKKTSGISRLSIGLGQFVHAAGQAESKVLQTSAGVAGQMSSQTSQMAGQVLQLLFGLLNQVQPNNAITSYSSR